MKQQLKNLAKLRSLSGLSLLEITVTLSVMLILAAIATYTYQGSKIRIRYNNTLTKIETAKLIIYNYYAKYKICPITPTTNNQREIFLVTTNNQLGGTILNDGCNIYLLNTAIDPNSRTFDPNNAIFTMLAKQTDLGELVYFCSTSEARAAEVKKYIPTCYTNGQPLPVTNDPT